MLKRISRNRYLYPDEVRRIGNKLCDRISFSGHTIFSAIFDREKNTEFYGATSVGLLNGKQVFALHTDERLELIYALRKRKEHVLKMKKETRERYENLNPIELVILKITLRRYL